MKWNNKGITIVGTLVASAIGLIVVAGTTHLLIQLTSRIDQQEGRAKRPLFYFWLAGVLEDPDACEKTLGDYALSSGEFDVAKIKNAAGAPLINFYNAVGKKKLKNEFGISNFDRLRFTDYNSIKKEAKLVLYTKSLLHKQIPVFNKNFTLNLINVTDDGGSPTKKVTGCVAGVSRIGAILENIRLENELTSIGGGTTQDIPAGMDTTAYGYNAGSGDLTGRENTFIGIGVGESTTSGKANTFVGYHAGKANTTGGWNTFVGRNAGLSNIGGGGNVFVGNRTGEGNETGGRNTFIGVKAGFQNTTGSHNIFIGDEAADLPAYQTASNKFVVGTSATSRDWIIGDIGTDDLAVNGKKVCLEDGTNCISSSRVYKKNIKSFQDFEKSLQDILTTPLFTYQYKKHHPEKSRMGLISEELPMHLQIQIEGAPSRPDWPSIYGTLWAGVKALTQRLAHFQKEVRKEVFLEIKQKMEVLFQDFHTFKQEISVKLASLDSTLKKEERAFKEGSRQIQEIKNRITENKRQLSETQSELDHSEKSLQKLLKALRETEKQFLESQALREKQWKSYEKKLKALEEQSTNKFSEK